MIIHLYIVLFVVAELVKCSTIHGHHCRCPHHTKPVCGQDGKNYYTACHADCSKVHVVSSGICPKSQARCAQECIQEEEFMCGEDGRTYASPCMAHCLAVHIEQAGPCP